MNNRNSKEKSSAETKIKWLNEHYGYWLPEYKERCIDKKLLVKLMKQEGLVGLKTRWQDIKLCNVLEEAYKQWQHDER